MDQDQDRLVQLMLSALEVIACRVIQLAEGKWGLVLEAIDEKLIKEKSEGETCKDFFNEDNQGELNQEEKEEPKKQISHPLKELYRQMKTYMSQVPVIGFNSAKYVLNLIKRCLAKYLGIHQGNNAFVVKRNNTYMCIATESLKFLDMSQFLAPGSSYSSFLKAYHITQQKGYFPYEWLDDINKLEFTTLPSLEDFYSQLNGSNITEEEYTYCHQVWRDHKMTTFRDFLVRYNYLDVAPFVQAVEKFQQFYFQKGRRIQVSHISSRHCQTAPV